MTCSFLCWGYTQVEQGNSPSTLAFFLTLWGQGWLFWSEWANICSISHGKAGKMRRKHKQEVVLSLRICFIVFEKGCYLVCSNNSRHVKHVVTDTNHNSSFIHPVFWGFFVPYKTQKQLKRRQKYTNYSEAKKLFKTFSPQNHSLS